MTMKIEKEEIKNIAESLDCGLRCFIHLKNLEIKFIPDYAKHPDMDPEAWAADSEEIDNNFSDYIEIKGMDPGESFQVMADFTDTVDDEELKERLISSLGRSRPFRNFKSVVDNSGEYRDKWFKFKEKKLMDWVEGQLQENRL
jgi:hypothetical protein